MGAVRSIEHYRFGAFELQLDDTKVCASSESARSSCVPTSPLRRRKTLPASPRMPMGELAVLLDSRRARHDTRG